MSYDDVLPHVGYFGRCQCRILAILLLPAIACALHKMGGVFLGARVDFRCLLPHENSKTAMFRLPPNITNLTYLWNEETKMWPQCERYDPNTAAAGENLTSTLPTVKCNSFVYDKTHGTESVTTEWNLVCDDAWLKSMSESLFMLSNLPGAIFWGRVSDRYGRKTVLLWGSTMQLIAAVLVSISQNFMTYAILRVLVGTTVSGLYLTGYVAAVEMVLPQHRTTVGVGVNLFYALAYVLSTVLAYFIRKWRYLQIAFTVPTMVLVTFLWSIPESARWLLINGRVQEARDILQKVSSENGKELSVDLLDGLLSDDNKSTPAVEKAQVTDLLRYPRMRRRTLSLFCIWLIIGVTYFGLSLNTSNLGGNDYANSGISGAVEIPACIILFFTLDRWGRRMSLSGSMLLSGISLFLILFVPSGMTWLTITLSMLGKFAITYSWGVTHVFTAELYPTAVRNVGVAACMAFAYIGASLAPQISHLFKISTYLPFVILGSLAFMTGLLSLRLPETSNVKLPETMEDGEKLEKYVSTCDVLRNRNKTQQEIGQLENIYCT